MMTYPSKKTLTGLITGLLLIIAYLVYALGNNAPAGENTKAWAVALLIFIGIGIAAMIVIQILFHIGYAIGIAVKERDCDDEQVERMVSSAMVEDERDKQIGLKSAHIGSICAGIGFIATLIAFALNFSAVISLHLLTGSFFMGGLIEGIISIYLYERGVSHG